MSASRPVLTCALPPRLIWRSFVRQSIAAWKGHVEGEVHERRAKDLLTKECHTMDEFMFRSVEFGTPWLWFFQKRSAFATQKRFAKWSLDKLDDYILLPGSNGYIWRTECFFVSHFWQTRDDPDPDGHYLRLHQAQLECGQWSYIWVDWTCLPQYPRTDTQELYFRRGLELMTALIRNCTFTWFYPPFEPRLWILYEITEYTLTCTQGIPRTDDNRTYLEHLGEMLQSGVQTTLLKHGYRCSDTRDKEYLISWLELIILLRRLQLTNDHVRVIMDTLTWQNMCREMYLSGVSIDKRKGTLVVNGRSYDFKPFPRRETSFHAHKAIDDRVEIASGRRAL
jgi:hypothetical protein